MIFRSQPRRILFVLTIGLVCIATSQSTWARETRAISTRLRVGERLNAITGLFVGRCDDEGMGDTPVSTTIHTNYATAVQAAKKNGKQLLICFDAPGKSVIGDSVEKAIANLDDEAKNRFEYVRLTTDETIKIGGQETRLIRHSSFSEMLNRNGIAIIDYENENSPNYGRVVTVYPANGARQYGSETLYAMSSLPPGTLTQRSLTLAVRLHPARPQSALASWNSGLANEAESHSEYQASLGNQGHHHWDTRFHRINQRLGNGMLAQEVCAESWPGQRLMDAAEECVDSWRQSSGHWSAVSGRQSFFSYDLKLGRNGIWYATGIFAR